jgi:glycosyltransferase involved in cell wall biosynthesis
MSSTAKLIAVPKHQLDAADVPDADVTIASWWRCMEWVQSYPACKGVKVHYIRGHEIWSEPERVARLYRSTCFKVVNSFWLGGLLQREYGMKAEVVQNGIDRAQFDSIPRERTNDGCIGFVYSASPLKDAATAFEAIRMVQRDFPKLRVKCFGVNPIESKSDLPSSLEFRYVPSQNEIADIYRTTDCWIIPSKSEGLPMPGLEAAACRCPIVATRCGGTEDYVRDGINGYLVPVGDARMMAERLLDLLKSPASRWLEMSEASYAISKEFDWDRSAEKLDRFLNECTRRVRS